MIKEKRLIINIMILRQLYECYELFKIRWINSYNNLANMMIKSNLNKILK